MNYTQENGINNGESSGEPERIELHHDWNNPAAHSDITTSDSGNGDNIDDSGDGDDVDGSGDNGDGSDVGDGGDSGNDNSDSSVIDNDEDFDDLPPPLHQCPPLMVTVGSLFMPLVSFTAIGHPLLGWKTLSCYLHH